MNPLTRSLIRHAHAVAREVGAKAVLLNADVVEGEREIADLIRDVDFRLLIVTKKGSFRPPPGLEELCSVVRVPDLKMTRAGQIKVALLVAAASGLVGPLDRIVCTTGIDGSGRIDTILVLEMGTEIELVAARLAEPLPPEIDPAVFERGLNLATELGLEGREGRTVGALFILGGTDRVMQESRQLVINPFHGYPEGDRNVLDPRLEDTVKEFSAIDGAFIVRGDGVILSAGRYLMPSGRPEHALPAGLGTRHEAAAAITVTSDSVALCVSQSTGTISIFRGGRLLTDLRKPRSQVSDVL